MKYLIFFLVSHNIPIYCYFFSSLFVSSFFYVFLVFENLQPREEYCKNFFETYVKSNKRSTNIYIIFKNKNLDNKKAIMGHKKASWTLKPNSLRITYEKV